MKRKLVGKLRKLWLGCIFYSKLSFVEIKRRLFNFTIGMISCTITIFVAAVISTIVDNAPFVILKQAENNCGQYDIELTPRYGPYINYSLVQETLFENNLNEINKLSTSRYIFNDSSSLFFTKQCIQQIDDFQINQTSNLLIDEANCKPKILNNPNYNLCQSHSSSLWIIDFKKEENMGFGSHFPSNLIPHKGEIVVNRNEMAAFDIKINDYLLLYIDFDNGHEQNLLYSMIRSQIETKGKQQYITSAQHCAKQTYCSKILFPVKIIGFIDETAFGKFGQNENKFTFIINIEGFTEYLKGFAPKKLSTNPVFNSLWSNSLILSELSSHTFYNIPNRIKYYLTLNYQLIQNKFSYFSSSLMYYLGFTQLLISTPIESEFYKLRFGALFFELILNVILLTLIILSILLLYSLLIISVETRGFEVGVLRMIGMTRKQLIKLLINQSLLFSIPSLIFAIILSQIIIYYLLIIFSDLIGYHIIPIISFNGWLRAIFVGFFVPLISSILPIKNALSKNLSDAINTDKSGPEIIEYKIERSEQSNINHTILIIGFILILFGVGTYYLFPLSLITQNLSLLLFCFFALMVSMLIGLSLLSFNINHIIQKSLILLLFGWFESISVQHILYKNIIAHKRRNQKTYLMYSLSLGFILMIAVVYRVQINSIGLQILTYYGGKYFVQFPNNQIFRYQDIQNRFNQQIESITFKYKPYPYLEHKHIFAFDFSKIDKTLTKISMISPDYTDIAQQSLFSFADNRHSPLSINHNLYSAKGSQSGIIGYTLRQNLYLDTKYDKKLIIRIGEEDEIFDNNNFNNYVILNILSFINVFPGYHELSKISFGEPSIGLSIPTTLRWDRFMKKELNLINNKISLEDMFFDPHGILIKFRSNITDQDIDIVKQYINEYGISSFDYNDFMVIMKSTNDIMDIVFSVSTYIALFLCLFSVLSSMYVNIFEQSKEVAILRAIGFNKFTTYKIYLYEATILILSSSLMGIAIGSLVGFTMTAQIALYASYPIQFDFPLKLLIIIIISAFLSAFFSVILPLIQLLRKNVSHIMRVNF